MYYRVHTCNDRIFETSTVNGVVERLHYGDLAQDLSHLRLMLAGRWLYRAGMSEAAEKRVEAEAISKSEVIRSRMGIEEVEGDLWSSPLYA